MMAVKKKLKTFSALTLLRYVIVDLLKAKWDSYIKKSFFRCSLSIIYIILFSVKPFTMTTTLIFAGSFLHSQSTSVSPLLPSHLGITRCTHSQMNALSMINHCHEHAQAFCHHHHANDAQETQYDCPANETVSNSTLFNSTTMNATEDLEMVCLLCLEITPHYCLIIQDLEPVNLLATSLPDLEADLGSSIMEMANFRLPISVFI